MRDYLHNKFNSEDQESPISITGFERFDLAKLFKEVGFSHGAEIGVRTGEYSWLLCLAMKGLEHICVDPWLPYTGDVNGRYRSVADVRRYYLSCRKLLKPYNVRYIKKTSSEAALEVPKNSLDFVHIDADHHYDYVKNDVEIWSDRVRSGGIVSGHDYTIDDVFRFINAYAKDRNIELFLTDDKVPTWFFAKEN
jgi:hypothetical protein